jgi:hypothetical protein
MIQALKLFYHSEEDAANINISGATIAADFKYLRAGLGCGFYYHFIQTNVVDLAFGLKATIEHTFEPFGGSASDYSSYFNLSFQLMLPLILDIKLSKNFIFRLSYEEQA